MMLRFALAPMDTLMRVLTWFCLALPAGCAAAALFAPTPVSLMLIGPTGFFVLIYAFIWFWMRPRAFVLEPDALVIEWPLRRRRIPTSTIVTARVLTSKQLREELGRIMRVGAGGLWGGFGLAKTSKGYHELWVSRVDRIVLVECEGRRSLLITPEDPDRFVAALPKR